MVLDQEQRWFMGSSMANLKVSKMSASEEALMVKIRRDEKRNATESVQQ